VAQLRNNKNKSCKQRRGIALIELAVVLPLLLTITFGVMEYGWMFLKANQVANAARQGARVGARPNATAGTISTAVALAMGAGGMSNPSSGTPVYSLTVTPANPTTLQSGQQLTVRVQVTYSTIDLGLPLIPVPTNLTSEVTMAREGP
jgi:Flp pilus assembly protein TadG